VTIAMDQPLHYHTCPTVIILLLILIITLASIGHFHPELTRSRRHRTLVIIGPGNTRTLLFHNLALGRDNFHPRCRRVVNAAISSKYEISFPTVDLVVHNAHHYSKISSVALKSMKFLIFAIDESAHGKLTRSIFAEELTRALKYILSTQTVFKVLILSKSSEFEMVEEDMHSFRQFFVEERRKEFEEYGTDILSCMREVNVGSFDVDVQEINQLIIDWAINS